MLRNLLETVIAKARIQGEGTMTLPDPPVPPVSREDLARDSAADYFWAATEHVGGATLAAWIRRAVHAEAFARSLEAEVERLRHGGH